MALDGALRLLAIDGAPPSYCGRKTGREADQEADNGIR